MYGQPLGTHAYWYWIHINIFLCLFTLEQQQLSFRILSRRDVMLNHIKAMGIYHTMKRFDVSRAYQVWCNQQARVVISLSQVKLQIIVHSVCLQDIVRLSHRKNDMTYLHRLGLARNFRKVETESLACLSFRMCSESSRVLQEIESAHISCRVIESCLQLPASSFNHWRMLGMCMALIQDNRFTLSHFWTNHGHRFNECFRCMDFTEKQGVGL